MMRFVLAGMLGLATAVVVGLLLSEVPASGQQQAARPVCSGYVCTPSPTPNRPGDTPSSHPPTTSATSPAAIITELPHTGDAAPAAKWIFLGLGLGAVTVGVLLLAYTLMPRRAA